jgi:hypothetical protein
MQILIILTTLQKNVIKHFTAKKILRQLETIRSISNPRIIIIKREVVYKREINQSMIF